MPTIKFARGQGAASALLDYVQGKQQEAVEREKNYRDFRQKLTAIALEGHHLKLNLKTGDVEEVPSPDIPSPSSLSPGETQRIKLPDGREIELSGPKQTDPFSEALRASTLSEHIQRIEDRNRLARESAEKAYGELPKPGWFQPPKPSFDEYLRTHPLHPQDTAQLQARLTQLLSGQGTPASATAGLVAPQGGQPQPDPIQDDLQAAFAAIQRGADPQRVIQRLVQAHPDRAKDIQAALAQR